MPPVTINKKFISFAESSFFRVLQQAIGDQGHLLAEVALNRLLWLPEGNQRGAGKTWWNKIQYKTVDFVVLDATTLRPRVAIELDDSSHKQARRQARDAEVEQLLRAAGLPLERFDCRRTYHLETIRQQLLPHLLPQR